MSGVGVITAARMKAPRMTNFFPFSASFPVPVLHESHGLQVGQEASNKRSSEEMIFTSSELFLHVQNQKRLLLQKK